MTQPGRNDPCPCGSGKKFKKCCIDTWVAPEDSPCEIEGHVHGGQDVFLDEIDLLSNQVPDLIRQGRIDAAQAVVRRLVKEFPDALDGEERAAEVEEARGNWAEAARMYRAVAAKHLEADPEYGHEPADHYLALAKTLERKAAAAGDATPGATAD